MNINPKIMIIDDEPTNIDVMYDVLKNDYLVVGVTGANEALALLNDDDKPDIILLDICMPMIDGYEVCRRLKESPHTSDIPVIFLTAADNDEDEVCGFALGAVDFITKPIRPSVVKARIQTHLELRRKQIKLEKLTKELKEVIRIFENKITIPSKIKHLESDAKTQHVEEFDITKVFLDDHRMDMLELESLIDAKINLMSLKGKIDAQHFASAKESLFRYGDILSLYPDFVRVGNGLQHFANRLYIPDDLQPSTMELILVSMEVMVFTMLRWREQLFNGELEDLHAYDDSLLADMETILSLLEPSCTISNSILDDDSDNLCFF